MRLDEGADEPAPRGPLVIGAVALDGIAFVAAVMIGLAGSETAQAERREQLARDDIEHAALAHGVERTVVQRHREDLVGTDPRVVAVRSVDHVEETAALLVPEAIEARPRALGERVD